MSDYGPYKCSRCGHSIGYCDTYYYHKGREEFICGQWHADTGAPGCASLNTNGPSLIADGWTYHTDG